MTGRGDPAVGPYGDRALLVEVDDVASAHLVAAAVDRARRPGQAPDGIEETVVGLRQRRGPPRRRRTPTSSRSRSGWPTWLGTTPGAGATPDATGDGRAGRHVDDPGRPSTAPTSERWPPSSARPPAAVVELAVPAPSSQVAFVGFAPGFPYLVGLPPELAAVPRRATPRASVPAGSVAVGRRVRLGLPAVHPGRLACCSGGPRPGCSTRTVPPTPCCAPGDTVRFHRRAGGDRDRSDRGGPGSPPARPPLAARTGRYVEVLDPGLLSLVEDGGRRQVAALGVPRAGPADPDAMRLANRLVGNPDGTRGHRGHRRRTRPSGSPAGPTSPWWPRPRRSGGPRRRAPGGRRCVVPVEDGQVVTVGRVQGGLRAYLAVSGGLRDPAGGRVPVDRPALRAGPGAAHGR